MMDTRSMVYGGESTLNELRNFLGKRPGNYRVDPNYIRVGFGGHKPYFWDDYNRKWVGIRIGDKFYFDDYGIAVREKKDG